MVRKINISLDNGQSDNNHNNKMFCIAP